MNILVVKKLSEEQKKAVTNLQKLAFPNISKEEVEEDFYHPKSAHVLAYIDDVLIGWAGIHETEQEFEGKRIKLGGYGICTHPSWQRKGIAKKVSKAAKGFLNNQGCEVAFLSIEPGNKASIKLHQRNDFVTLPRDFSWTNSKGKVKRRGGGMIAPVNSQKLFENILNSKESLYVGRGYW